MVEASYISLYLSGELERRAENLKKRLSSCDICPHRCGVNRLKDETGFCRSGLLPIVSSFCAHHGEEPPLSGKRGSGTIFFGNCNMRCVYCQNYQISQNPAGQQANRIDINRLAEIMLYLQNDLKCHNINLVTPTHFVPQIILALLEAVTRGLTIPLVYNTSGYDSLEIIKLLDGIIDIYLPDLRYADNEHGKKYSGVPDYAERAREVIKEMYRQTGKVITGDDGTVERGLIVWHLILPNQIAGSEDSLRWLAEEISPEVTISLMSQYYPTHRAYEFPLLARKISYREYIAVLQLLQRLDMNNGWIQEMESSDYYRPDFQRAEHPFGAEG